MSAIYHIFSDNSVNDGNIKNNLLRIYAYLQQVRDDSFLLDIDIDLNDDFLRQQRDARLEELSASPFNLNIEQAATLEEEVSGGEDSSSA